MKSHFKTMAFMLNLQYSYLKDFVFDLKELHRKLQILWRMFTKFAFSYITYR